MYNNYGFNQYVHGTPKCNILGLYRLCITLQLYLTQEEYERFYLRYLQQTLIFFSLVAYVVKSLGKILGMATFIPILGFFIIKSLSTTESLRCLPLMQNYVMLVSTSHLTSIKLRTVSTHRARVV